jgi:hypothetical protein
LDFGFGFEHHHPQKNLAGYRPLEARKNMEDIKRREQKWMKPMRRVARYFCANLLFVARLRANISITIKK